MLFENFKSFNSRILIINNKETIIPINIDCSFVRNDIMKEILDKRTTEAQYSTNKLVIKLGRKNYYFYYLDKKDNICEGYVEGIKDDLDDEFIDEFNNKTIYDLISSFLKKEKPNIKNNEIIYKLKYDKIVFKNNEDLINYIKNENINNYKNKEYDKNEKSHNDKYNIDNNDKIKDNQNEIIKCFIYYYYSCFEIMNLKMETILFYQGKRNEEIKYTPFYPINSDWIKLFKEKTNYNNSHHIIRTNNITKNNYSN